MMNKKIAILCSLMLLNFLSACGGYEPLHAQEVEPVQLGDRVIVDQTKADNAKKIILAMEEVVEVKGVTLKENIYVAPRVKHFDRLHLEGIRKTGFKNVKKRYPDETVFLSTDKKIYMELEKLELALQEKRISEEQLEKKLKKLEEDMKG